MVIRPYGYALWEKVQENSQQHDAHERRGKCLLSIIYPHSLLDKEKEHVKGFCAGAGHCNHRRREELKDPLVVRPTSETIMYAMYAKWVQFVARFAHNLLTSGTTLVRWEKRTYLFLRTTEFLWQEGHTAHATEAEDMDMVLSALEWLPAGL